jgi:1-acyl-sn-glycerol-3-phosphate acyltransferase
MKKALAKLIFYKLMGWTIETPYPNEKAPKSVIMVMPHTSNWDFPIGILIRPILDFESHFVGKKSLFFFPLGNLLRWLGGVAVDRSKKTNFVEACAALFEGRKKFQLTLTPEGTRRKVTQLKSGFYFIALKAKVPIVCCKFDWGKKLVGFAEPFYPTGDYETDLRLLLQYFKGVRGKIPAFDFEIKD